MFGLISPVALTPACFLEGQFNIPGVVGAVLQSPLFFQNTEPYSNILTHTKSRVIGGSSRLGSAQNPQPRAKTAVGSKEAKSNNARRILVIKTRLFQTAAG